MEPWPIGPKLATCVGHNKLNAMVMSFTRPSMTKKVRGGPEGVALPPIILRGPVISTSPSMTTRKCEAAPKGAPCPYIIVRGTAISTHPSMTTFERYS